MKANYNKYYNIKDPFFATLMHAQKLPRGRKRNNKKWSVLWS